MTNTVSYEQVKTNFHLFFLDRKKKEKKTMNHWAVQPNAFAAGGDLRNSVSVVERDQAVVVCPKPRRIGLRNPLHHPSRSLRCYNHQVESKAEADILDIILTKV